MSSKDKGISKIIIGILGVVLLVAAGGTMFFTATQTQQAGPNVEMPKQVSNNAPLEGADPANKPPTTVVIKAVSTSAFTPSSVNIRVGSTAIWDNVDDEIHTATSGNFTNGDLLFHKQLNPGEKFQFTFDKPGTYYFSCVIAFHEMSGIIRVHP
ncbi:MAG: hypothetical protein FJ358_06910 [Thaumarchaeota archaeon]|nr:hypothetical protein [Nitrososphaerota archaeon]